MSAWFAIAEGLKSFKRARLATTISITSIGLALILLGCYALFIANVDRLIGDFRSQMEMEVFFEPDIAQTEIEQLVSKIKQISGVHTISVITRDQAAQRFKDEFGQDVFNVLGTNPLPPSVIIKIAENYQSSAGLQTIADQVKIQKGVDDVIYQGDLLKMLDQYLHIVYLVLGTMGVLMLIIAGALLFNTIRLTIYARKDIIEIMQLVGAKKTFIRRPFIIEGFFQGLFGAILACGFIYLIARLVMRFIYPYLQLNQEIYFLLVALGIIIGYVSSRMSVGKYLKRL